MADNEELKITRTDSSVEITVGSEGSDFEKQELDEPASNKDICVIFCCKPLSKIQLYWLTIIAINLLFLALIIIVILIGVVASNANRITELEKKVEHFTTSHTALKVLVQDQADSLSHFQSKMDPTVQDLSSQLGISYLHTLKLYSVGEEQKDRLDLLTNTTESLQAQLSQANIDIAMLERQIKTLLEEKRNSTTVRDQATTPEKSHSKASLVNDRAKTEEQSNDQCERFVICVKSHTGHRVCTPGIAPVYFHRVRSLFLTSIANFEYQCVSRTP